MNVEVSVLKGGREVASAHKVFHGVFGRTGLAGVDSMDCFYFPTISLAPPVAFEHLSGVALSCFLDRCAVVVGDQVYEPVRYVHGRSEVLKGNHTVSSVLLAKVCGPVSDTQWLGYLPEIYKRFMGAWDSSLENA